MPPSKRYRPHVPLEKRKRTVRACTSCRESKKKCLLASRGECKNCMRSGRTCVFESASNDADETRSQGSPKHKSTMYSVGSWKTLVGDVSQKFTERCPDNTLDPVQFSILSQLFYEAVNTRESYRTCDQPSHGGETSGHPNVPLDDTFNVRSLSSKPSTAVVFDGESSRSHESFVAAVSETISAGDFKVQNTNARSREDHSHVNKLARQEETELLSAAVASLPAYEDVESLTAVFFAYLESNWYYFDEYWFRDLLAQLYWGPPLPELQCTTVCLVFLVLALGSSFSHLQSSTPVYLLETGPTSDEIPGRNFYVQAMRLIPGAIAAGSIESVVCCLLTALFLLPTQDISHHHAYLGLALRLAIGLSLHRKGTDSETTSRESELKKRIFWTAYCIERQTSVVMGLPTMLQSRDITIDLPQKREDLDGFDAQKVGRLIAFTELTLAMDKVIDARPIEYCPDKFSWACSTLESWKKSLPAHLVVTEDSSLRATAHLDIMYNMIWVNIGRTVLLRLVRSRLYPSTNGESNDMATISCSQELSERCTQGATTIIEWIDLLRVRNRLAKFSFTDFHSCSSAIIVLLLDVVLRPQNWWSSSIARGMDALRFMASGSHLARDALHLLERMQAGVQQSIRTPGGRPLERQVHSQPPVLTSPQGEFHNQVEEVLPFSPTDNFGTDYTVTDFAMLESALFSGLEPSLLSHSDQTLVLFGFDGFCPNTDIPM